MEYASIIAVHNDTVSSDISYNDPIVDYIVYCELDFYGVIEDNDDACDNTDKRTYLGSIKGYLILTHFMELMGEDAYIVCDDHSGELEMVMSIITKQGQRELDEDVLYITDADLPDDVFRTIMLELPNIIMRHYHSYPELIVYYPEPLPYEKEKSPIHKAKEQMAQIIARDIKTSDNTVSKDGQTIQLHLDNEQMNYILGRRNEYNVYPESAKNKAEFERFENVGFKEMGSTRLLYRASLSDIR